MGGVAAEGAGGPARGNPYALRPHAHGGVPAGGDGGQREPAGPEAFPPLPGAGAGNPARWCVCVRVCVFFGVGGPEGGLLECLGTLDSLVTKYFKGDEKELNSWMESSIVSIASIVSIMSCLFVCVCVSLSWHRFELGRCE